MGARSLALVLWWHIQCYNLLCTCANVRGEFHDSKSSTENLCTVGKQIQLASRGNVCVFPIAGTRIGFNQTSYTGIEDGVALVTVQILNGTLADGIVYTLEFFTRSFEDLPTAAEGIILRCEICQ